LARGNRSRHERRDPQRVISTREQHFPVLGKSFPSLFADNILAFPSLPFPLFPFKPFAICDILRIKTRELPRELSFCFWLFQLDASAVFFVSSRHFSHRFYVILFQ